MNDEKYIAAIEISSSKITGAIGKATPDGNLTVVAMKQEESKDSVRFGIIQNPEEVSNKVSRIIDSLNHNSAVAPRRIKSVFVGLSGRSLKSIPSNVKLIFPEATEITDDILERLREDAASIAIESNLEIVKIVPRSYVVDKLETNSPKGAIGKTISAVFDIIVCRHDMKRNINRAIPDRLGLTIDGFIVTPLALSAIVLTEEEKRLGCMLVDFGAETTTVCIYRKGSLHYFNTLPLGGRNITRDITTLSILEEKAEEIKCESCKAIPRETPSTLNLNGVKLSEVSNLVVARAEEIVANVIQQIFYAGLKEKDLPAGIICVGGGSNLNGILELLQTQSGLNARTGHLPSYISSTEPKAKRLEAIQVDAILNASIPLAKENCIDYPENTAEENDDNPDTMPAYGANKTSDKDSVGKSKLGKFFSNITDRVSNIFAPPAEDDDSEL